MTVDEQAGIDRRIPHAHHEQGPKSMTSHIKLYGSKSSRFEELKGTIEAQLGYEPSNPEVVGLIMAAYETEENNALQVNNARRR